MLFKRKKVIAKYEIKDLTSQISECINSPDPNGVAMAEWIIYRFLSNKGIDAENPYSTTNERKNSIPQYVGSPPPLRKK